MKISSDSLTYVSDTVDFITQSVYKDEIAGNNAETQDSAIKAAEYLSAVLKTDNKSDADEQLIIDTYIELNPYYKNLQDTYGIEPYVSRLAKDFDIIYQPATFLQDKPFLKYFRSIYKECLTAMYFSTYSKALEAKENYRQFFLMSINVMTLIRLLHKWLENPFDIDLMNESILDRFMATFGITYFTNLPLPYKLKIARNLNKLIVNKGTDQVIIDILDIFDFKNIKINKYYLVRDQVINLPNGTRQIIRNPRFYGHDVHIGSLTQAIKENNYQVLELSTMTNNDEHWQADSNEIANKNFDYIQTKYFSVESGFELTKEAINTAYLFNLIKRISATYPKYELLNLNISAISPLPLELIDIIITMKILTLEYYGLVDIIFYDVNSIGGVYDFAPKDDPILTGSAFNLNDPNIKLANTVTDLSKVSLFTKDKTLSIWSSDLSVLENLKAEMRKEKSYKRFRNLLNIYRNKFIQKLNNSMYNGAETYTDYMAIKSPELYNYIMQYKNMAEGDDKQTALEAQIVFLSDVIQAYLPDTPLVYGSTATGILSTYLREIISTFKSFTTTLKNLDIFIIVREDFEVRKFDDCSFQKYAINYDREINLHDAYRWSSTTMRQNENRFRADIWNYYKLYSIKDKTGLPHDSFSSTKTISLTHKKKFRYTDNFTQNATFNGKSYIIHYENMTNTKTIVPKTYLNHTEFITSTLVLTVISNAHDINSLEKVVFQSNTNTSEKLFKNESFKYTTSGYSLKDTSHYYTEKVNLSKILGLGLDTKYLVESLTNNSNISSIDKIFHRDSFAITETYL